VPEALAEKDAALMALARRLTERAARGRVLGLTRLAGGRNNRVYRLETDHGVPLVLKCYFSDIRDTRDRLGAEWNFITHAWSLGIRNVPEPLACDAAEHAGLFGFVRGRKLAASELTQAHVDAAIDFVLAVNTRPRPAMAAGSEACFSLSEHIAMVERRVERLSMLDAAAPHLAEVKSLVSTRLLPAWAEVKSRLNAEASAAGLSMDEPIGADERCLSPSDFGFHNALVDDEGRLSFLDFEYAGLDDPAKLVCDFFCQPEIPVTLAYHAHFIDRMAQGLALNAAAIARCRLLLNGFRVKWTCIMLNDFVPLDSARRVFAGEADRAISYPEQLEKANARMAEIEAAIS
jgi:aminoglycoside phosphotransferase (APT) family kinase protein